MGKFWDTLKAKFEQKFGSVEVTLQTLTLGARHARTGWRTKTFTDSTIDMIISTKGVNFAFLPSGIWTEYDAVGLTDTEILGGCRIAVSTTTYEVKRQQPILSAPSTIEYYVTELQHITSME